jgi:hypothetical protein
MKFIIRNSSSNTEIYEIFTNYSVYQKESLDTCVDHIKALYFMLEKTH